MFEDFWRVSEDSVLLLSRNCWKVSDFHQFSCNELFLAKSSVLCFVSFVHYVASEYRLGSHKCYMLFLSYYRPCFPMLLPFFPFIIHPIHVYYCSLLRIYNYVHYFLFSNLSFLYSTISSALDSLCLSVLSPHCVTLRSLQQCYKCDT
jgi:hypothetical protein